MAKSSAKIVVGLRQTVESAAFKIEKGVPIPNWVSRKYPLGDMNVGDSFLIETPNHKELRRVRAAACFYGKRKERFYSVRKDQNKPGSYRCWRVE